MAEKICGIYCIRNLGDGKVYVGQTSDMKSRFRQHRSLLKRGIHGNLRLQSDWNLNGEDGFSFELIQACELVDLESLEIKFIERLQSSVENKGYNIENGGNKGKSLAEVTKRKLSIAHKGKVLSEETRKKMKNNATGGTNPNATLDEDKVLAIKTALGMGKNVATLKRTYGVSESTLYNIKNGRSWKHV